MAMLQSRGRVSYRMLQRQFGLDDAALEDLKDAILFAHLQVVDEAGRGLVWAETPAPAPVAPPAMSQPAPPAPAPALPPPEAERRQLTVMFCDLADSTQLSGQLDPEDLRTVLRAYQQASVAVIERFEGYVAQYLGDGLLVYFGWPQPHEDDAQRAVRAGVGILEAMDTLNARLAADKGLRLVVRLGVHTGPVVVGEMGAGGRHEQLALGETPNVAALAPGRGIFYRSVDAGMADAAHRAGANQSPLSAADKSPGVSAALGPSVLPHPACTQSPDPTPGCGHGRPMHRRQNLTRNGHAAHC
jgi:class 3 adenylate cyclase